MLVQSTRPEGRDFQVHFISSRFVSKDGLLVPIFGDAKRARSGVLCVIHPDQFPCDGTPCRWGAASASFRMLHSVRVGQSVCMPSDTFDHYTGADLALKRALGEELPDGTWAHFYTKKERKDIWAAFLRRRQRPHLSESKILKMIRRVVNNPVLSSAEQADVVRNIVASGGRLKLTIAHVPAEQG